jgi:hypothetical protein
MSTNTVATLESRVLNEGYGPGAWHGSDLKAALADLNPALAFWRPGAGRHNIAEIALHHAYCVAREQTGSIFRTSERCRGRASSMRSTPSSSASPHSSKRLPPAR